MVLIGTVLQPFLTKAQACSVEIRKIVDDREKTAAAKRKVALPIILLLVSCEMELDTEIALQSVWKQLRTLFRSKV